MAGQYLHEALDGVAIGDAVVIEGPEAHHAASVARVRLGERIRVSDGGGLVVAGAVMSVARDRVEVAVDEVTRDPEPRLDLHLVQALAKGDRDELAVQAATELGVSGIVPWQAGRSVSRWTGPKIRKGVERWRTIVREAAKQSLRARVPSVTEPLDTAGLVQLTETEIAGGGCVIVLDPEGAQALVSLFGADARLGSARRVLLVVGPEGGIDAGELARLEAAGATRARLGGSVLRTSTAGPAAIAVMQALRGDWAGTAEDSP